MLQSTGDQVWGFGRGQVRTVARLTRADGVDTVLGPMLFIDVGGGRWTVKPDVSGFTAVRYVAARILAPDGAGFASLQAAAVIPGDGSVIDVQIRDVNIEDNAVLPDDCALVIDLIVDQTGTLEFSFGPQLPPEPVPEPEPAPRPPPSEPPPRIL